MHTCVCVCVCICVESLGFSLHKTLSSYTLRKPELKKAYVPPMFIAVIFTITRTREQPRCPSVDEWIRKLWYICTMEYYSAIKRNTCESLLMKWMNLEPIIQIKVKSERERQILHINAYIWDLKR